MEPADVNGLIPADRPVMTPHPSAPLTIGQVQTADFEASGNLLMLYRHLKDMYEPPIHSDSGPIKTMTPEEIQREQHKPQEDFVDSLPETVLGK
jgi:hypothetical protein